MSDPALINGLILLLTIVKKPAQYRLLKVRAEKYPNEWLLLTFSKDRGFFEPITNSAAEPVVGKILQWEYAE